MSLWRWPWGGQARGGAWYEDLPGTEIMTDVGAHQFVKSSNKPDRILVPQPSDSPRDPLVCVTYRRHLPVVHRTRTDGNHCRIGTSTGSSAPILVAAVTFAQGMSHLALAPVFPHLMEAFDSNHASVVQFAGVSSYSVSAISFGIVNLSRVAFLPLTSRF